MSLLLRNKELSSCSFCQVSVRRVGLCWWSWVLKVSLDSSTLSQIPELLGDGTVVGKSRSGVWGFPVSPEFSALTGQNGIRCLRELGVAPRVRVEVVCMVCVWDRGGMLTRASTVAKCGLQGDSTPHSHPQVLALRDVRTSRNLRSHFAS